MSWQTVDATCPGVEAYRRLRQPEMCMLSGDDDIAGQGDFEPSSQGVAVNGGNDRFIALKVVGNASETAWRSNRSGFCLGRALGLVFKVVTGREGAVASAGDEGYPHLGVVSEVTPDFPELLMSRRVQGIHHLRTVKGDIGNALSFFIDNIVVRHGDLLSAFVSRIKTTFILAQ
jgi:hypothetical protein